MKINLGNLKSSTVMRVRVSGCYSQVMSNAINIGIRLGTIMENVAANNSPLSEAPINLIMLTRALLEWLRNED